MTKITATNFKKKYLYIDKFYINKSLSDFINIYDDKNKLINSLKVIFPYLENQEAEIFINYISNTIIKYSNRFKLKLNKSLLSDYLNILQDDRIKVDVERLNFTKKFLNRCEGKTKRYSKIYCIDTQNLDYLDENKIYFYNYKEISNQKKFMNHIMSNDLYFKYLLHQDIHNSIINPILVSIMLLKYFKGRYKANPVAIQLQNIIADQKENEWDDESSSLPDKILNLDWEVGHEWHLPNEDEEDF